AQDGSLRLAMPHGEATIGAPVAWQDADGRRVDAKARWTLAKDGAATIETSPRDGTRVVHVDPTVTYESYLGGSTDDTPGGAAMDSSGAAYLGGATRSPGFPTTGGAYDLSKADDGSGTRADAFVTKINATGSALVYSTF